MKSMKDAIETITKIYNILTFRMSTNKENTKKNTEISKQYRKYTKNFRILFLL